MDALAQEIARKRKEREEAKASRDAAGGARKWMKRGELEQQRVESYVQAEAAAQEERAKKLVVPQRRYASTAPGEAEEQQQQPSVASSGATSLAGSSATGASSGGGGGAPVGGSGVDERLKPTDVMRRLRALGQPITLFGETDEERLERYTVVSSALPSESVVDLDLKKGQLFDETQLFDASGKVKKPEIAQRPPARWRQPG